MSAHHLAAALADLTRGIEGTIPQNDYKLLCAQLAGLFFWTFKGYYIPTEHLAKINDNWKMCDDSTYDSVTFNRYVPAGLSEKNPVVEADDNLFVYGHNGEFAFYWKFEHREL